MSISEKQKRDIVQANKEWMFAKKTKKIYLDVFKTSFTCNSELLEIIAIEMLYVPVSIHICNKTGLTPY